MAWPVRWTDRRSGNRFSMACRPEGDPLSQKFSPNHALDLPSLTSRTSEFWPRLSRHYQKLLSAQAPEEGEPNVSRDHPEGILRATHHGIGKKPGVAALDFKSTRRDALGQ